MKNKILIIRITEEEENIIKILRKDFSINISSLLREMIKKYYEKIHHEKK
jgi:hypothetical protein